jgi:hypothetical protein
MSEGAERATDGWIGNFLDVLVMTPVAVVGAVYVFLPFVLFALELVALPLLVILAAGRPFVEARSQDGRTVSIIRRSGSPGATDSRLMTRLEAADGSLS